MKPIKTIATALTLLSATALTAFADSSAAGLAGYVRYNTEGQMGWYTLDDKGATTFQWIDELGEVNTSPMIFGWLRNGRICGISSRSENGVIYNYDYIELDPKTGESYKIESVPMHNEDDSPNYLANYKTAVYDSKADRVYGYGYNEDGTAFVFKSSTPDFKETKIIRTIPDDEYCYTLAYNDVDGRIVGFNRTDFVYISQQTGEQTVAYSPRISNYQSTYTAMAYDLSKRKYYWNYFTKDGVSHMALVDLSGKEMAGVCDYTNLTQFSFMVMMGSQARPTAPEAPVITSLDFDKASLSGSVSFTLPSKLNNGTAITGNVDWRLLLDDKEVKSGSAAAGAQISETVTVAANGNHTFTLIAAASGEESLPAADSRYIGLDTPESPRNVVLNATTLTWQPVTAGIHNGYLDTAALSYEVKLNGTTLATTHDTSLAVTYPDDKEYTAYTASVKAVNASGSSETVESNVYCTGKPMSLPRTFAPDEQTSKLFSTETVGDDSSKWRYNNGARGQELFISGGSADEWLFLPPLACNDKNTVYSFSLNSALNSDGVNAAYIEVRAGLSADSKAMGTVIVPQTRLTRTSLHEYSGLFTLSGALANADAVVIGIRAYAPEGEARIKARRFKAEATKISVEAPSDPTDVSVKAAPKGELRATISFKMPETRLNGTPIESTQDVTVTVFTDSKKTFTGKPGEKQEFTLEAYEGINEIEITPALGNVKGQTRTYEVYCGNDVPMGVNDFKIEIAEDNLSAALTWTPPTEGINGGYVNESDLTYNLCTYDGSASGYKFYASLGATPRYDMVVNKGTKLATYKFAIQAVSKAGDSPVYMPALVQLGTPYGLDLMENFVDDEGKPAITCPPIYADLGDPYTGSSWKVDNPTNYYPKAETLSSVALIGSSDYPGTTGYVLLPKFSTKGMREVKLNFNTYRFESMPEVTVWARGYGMDEDVKVGTLNTVGSGYTPDIMSLPPQFDDLGWVSVHLTAKYTTYYQYVFISQYAFTAEKVSVEEIEGDNGVGVFGGKGEILIQGRGTAAVHNLQGLTIATLPLDGSSQRIAVEPGVYVVSADGENVKVFVR